jgi:hypothetical protein
MKKFGNLRTYDDSTRAGSIRPEGGGPPIPFEAAAVPWHDADTPEVDARLSYYVGRNRLGAAVALNLRPA